MCAQSKDFIVIGAGISGLLCANKLQAAGHSVAVIDKGRGVGGRMSTRRMEGAYIDHGAQYFTVREARFQKYVDAWLEAGVIREWFRHLPIDSNPEGYPRYCGVNGMSDVAKYLSRGLEVHSLQQVIEVVKELGYWSLLTHTGERYEARHLVVTAPLPQAVSLLQTSGVNWAGNALSELMKVSYEKGLAALVILDGGSELPEPGGVKVESDVIEWIGDNQRKGISPDVSAVTIQATPEFAQAHWDAPDSLRGKKMIDAAMPHLKSKVVQFTCHRWGFTTPVNPWPELSYHNFELGLSLAGDAFGGARVEGAALSGLDAAEQILKRKIQTVL